MERYKEALAVALRYVSHKDRTECEVRGRLYKAEYENDVVDNVLDFLKENGYVNDRRYAEYYLFCYKEKRSIKRILRELDSRGIDLELIQNIIEESEIDGVTAAYNALEKQMRKRNVSDIKSISYEERNKVMAALFRQGYSAEDIIKAMSMCIEQE